MAGTDSVDKVDKMIEQTNAELEQSKRILQELANEITSLTEVVQPALEKQIGALRAARMATVQEIHTSLTALRDIRKFFLEDNYSIEMERLERFTRMCRELQSLKSEGVLDALVDTAIRLGLKEQG